jgi:hypothetical protein
LFLGSLSHSRERVGVRVCALGFSCGSRADKGASGQPPSRGRGGLRYAPTALRCSVSWPPPNSLRSLREGRSDMRRQECLRSAHCVRAATSPGLAGRAGPVARPLARHEQSTGLFVSGLAFSAPQDARRRLPRCTFAVALVAVDLLRHTHWWNSRQAVPVEGDFCGDEKRRAGVGARSALRKHTCRSLFERSEQLTERGKAKFPQVFPLIGQTYKLTCVN